MFRPSCRIRRRSYSTNPPFQFRKVLGVIIEQCFHGGAFWQSLDSQFQSKKGFDSVINADVLDAWFPPSPMVANALDEFKAISSQTSPPTHAEGLVAAIAETYSIPSSEVLVGAGSSSLWFLVARSLLNSQSKVLLVEPSYGEYRHVCLNLLDCQVEVITTRAEQMFHLDLGLWIKKANGGVDMAVLVNPNNPTGHAIPRDEILKAIGQISPSTLVLIDEAYMDFWNPQESLLRCPTLPDNVIVISTFSKRFALSGLRVAMLRASSRRIKDISRWTPPWAVSMPAQIAGCAALRDPEYYAGRYAETHILSRLFAENLKALGLTVHGSCANWLNLNINGAEQFCNFAARAGLFIRNLGITAPSLSNAWVRIAVKDSATNERIARILDEVLSENLVPKSFLV